MTSVPAHRSRPSRRQFIYRRLAVGAVAILMIAGAGVGIATAFGRASGAKHQGVGRGPGGTVPAATAPAAPPTTVAPPPPPTEPGGGRRLFPGRRIVAFYGAPGGSALGVLGGASPEATWPALAAQAAPYAEPGTRVLPAYELITFVAQASPGPDGSYAARLPDAEIEDYLSVVRAHHGLLILDIQPGRGGLLADAKTLTRYLIHPDVGLALDPEWEVGPPQLPGQVIGHTTAVEINSVGGWLNHLTRAHRLPQKLLLIHQFTPEMIQDKPSVRGWYHLATVFNMDGFGGWDNKVSVYESLAADPRWHLGFKLFYRQDAPLYPPTAVLALRPSPLVIEYE